MINAADNILNLRYPKNAGVEERYEKVLDTDGY
jgi:hypothetical protein